jgi:exopolysaccharide/PEP-CTERM locus tyrosine autokinase
MTSTLERALARAGALARSQPTAPAEPRAPRSVAGKPAADQPAADPFEGVTDRRVDIDPVKLRAAGLAPSAESAQRIAEELRVIKRPVLVNAENPAQIPAGNLVMIGGPLPGAGKTFMSMNIAISLATEFDWKVLLVDADLSRPTLSRGLGVADAPGLVGLLQNEGSSLADHVYSTDNPNLLFLPAGTRPASAKELLGSQRMRTLLAELTARPRQIVIFDSPPLLLTSEARVLASYVGQIVLVVEASRTPRRSLLEAIELLDPSKAINLVLNKTRQMIGVGDYHYAGYESYGDKSEPESEGKTED